MHRPFFPTTEANDGEWFFVDLMDQLDVSARLHGEGFVHDGVELAFRGRRHRIYFRQLIGKTVTVYGQTEVTRDLMDRRAGADGVTLYEAEAVGIEGLASAS